jgi:hypothetical protein
MSTVKRGQESWQYIYIALGFAVTFEGTIIQLAPIPFPWNLLLFLFSGFVTGWLFLFNSWVHNKLIGFKAKYEDREWPV